MPPLTLDRSLPDEIPEVDATTKKHAVIEIFGPTIQGEGQVVGYQTLFIRFGGCDYRCTQCDSLHAVLPDQVKLNAEYLTAGEIYRRVEPILAATGCKWVTLSGGNPAIHDLSELVFILKQKGIKISVETQGTMWRDWITFCDAVVVSPKAPGMGETFNPESYSNFLDKLAWHPNAIVKIVVFNKLDIEFAKDTMAIIHPFFDRPNRKYLSLGNPMPPAVPGSQRSKELDMDELLRNYHILLEEILADPYTKDMIVLPQVHVLLWGNKQGV